MRKDFRFFKNNFNCYKLLNGYKTKMICFYYLLIQTKFQWKLNLKKVWIRAPARRLSWLEHDSVHQKGCSLPDQCGSLVEH